MTANLRAILLRPFPLLLFVDFSDFYLIRSFVFPVKSLFQAKTTALNLSKWTFHTFAPELSLGSVCTWRDIFP